MESGSGSQIGFALVAILVVLIGIVVLTQIQIRKQYTFMSPLPPDAVLQNAARAVGGGQGQYDAAGDLSVPFRNGIMSISAEPTNGGTAVHVWLSRYPFFGANGMQVMSYQRNVGRVRRAVQAS